MKISTKGRYGLRAVLYLAIHAEAGHVAIHQIAADQDLSVGYTEQIFSTLRKSGIVKSVKGAQGGYSLADHPQNISVATILTALEGDLAFNQQDDSNAANPLEQTIARKIWLPLDSHIEKLLKEVSLQDLIEDYQANDGSAFVFVI